MPHTKKRLKKKCNGIMVCSSPTPVLIFFETGYKVEGSKYITPILDDWLSINYKMHANAQNHQPSSTVYIHKTHVTKATV
jgi:hypothetical protein